MTATTAVSVIMPAYKAADTLTASVRSVQAQTLQNWELIIVDDGSPDNTLSMARLLAEGDRRIKVISQQNSGPSIARNNGVTHAKADILAFLDADDFWAPERLLGSIVALDKNHRAGVVFSRTRFVDANTLKPGTVTPHIPRLTAADLMAENAVCSTSNIVCLRAVFDGVGGFTSGLDYAEDQDWLLRVALNGRWAIVGLDAEWFFYRSSNTSQSSDLDAMREGWLKMVEAACNTYPQTAPAVAQRAFGPSHRHLARKALRLMRPGAALRYMYLALSQDPLLLLRQPKRTAFTLCGVLLAFLPSSTLKELVTK